MTIIYATILWKIDILYHTIESLSSFIPSRFLLGRVKCKTKEEKLFLLEYDMQQLFWNKLDP